MKTSYVARWLDDYHAPFRPITRERVAYLLRAARSRNDRIHVTRHVHHRNWKIGELAIKGTWENHRKALQSELSLIRGIGYRAYMDGDKIAVKFDGDEYGKFERVSTLAEVLAIQDKKR